MENASKAIVIAGGILISICIISIFYFMFGRVSDTMQGTQSNTAQKELRDFNTGFEAYNKKLMYGADIISVLNKAIDNNRKYKVEFYNEPIEPDYLDYYINIVFVYEGETYSLKDNFTKYTSTKRNIIQEKFLDKAGLKEADPENIFQFKISGFRCTSVTYNKPKDTTNTLAIGRVKEMRFEKFEQK